MLACLFDHQSPVLTDLCAYVRSLLRAKTRSDSVEKELSRGVCVDVGLVEGVANKFAPTRQENYWNQ